MSSSEFCDPLDVDHESTSDVEELNECPPATDAVEKALQDTSARYVWDLAEDESFNAIEGEVDRIYEILLQNAPAEELLEFFDISTQKRLISKIRSVEPQVPRERVYWYVGEWDEEEFVENPLIALDFCSGLGGFSEAFTHSKTEAGLKKWRVYRFDLERVFGDPSIADGNVVNLLELNEDHLPMNPTVVLFSPPCTCFSVAAVSHHWPGYKPGAMAQYHVKLLRHGIELINQIKPRYWLIENPMGMMRRVLGAPTVHTAWCAFGTEHKKPTDLWGKLPAMEWPLPVEWEKAARGTKSGTQGITREPWMPKGLTSGMLRSLIPMLFSKSVCEAIEQEVSLESRLLDSCDSVLREGLPLKKEKLEPTITYVGKKYTK